MTELDTVSIVAGDDGTSTLRLPLTCLKRAILVSSTGVNIGDDLMSRVLVNYLASCGFETEVSSFDPRTYRETYGTPTFRNRAWQVIRLYQRIQGARIVVVGGGTLVQNDHGRGRVSPILLKVTLAILAGILARRPVLLIGIGVERLSRLNRILAYPLRWSKYIQVRDEYSRMLVSRYAPGVPVSVAPDLAFAVKYFDKGLQCYATDVLRKMKGKRFLCVGFPKEGYGELVLSLLTEIRKFAAIQDMGLVLVACDTREDQEQMLYEAALGRGARSHEIIFVPRTPYDVAAICKAAYAVVATRLHLCIISLLAGLQPLVVAREGKMEFLRQYVHEDNYLHIDTEGLGQKITSRLEAVVASGTRTAANLDQLSQAELEISRAFDAIKSRHL